MPHTGCKVEPFAKKWIFDKHVVSKHYCSKKDNCPLEHPDKTEFKCSEIIETFHNDKINIEQLCNTLQGRLSDKEIDQLLKDSPGLINKLKRIGDIVSEFKQKKTLNSIIEDNVSYGYWIDPIVEAKDMIIKYIEYLRVNNILYDKKSPIYFKLSIDACRVSGNQHHIVLGCIKIVSGAVSLPIEEKKDDKTFIEVRV
ncbi:hypothetical protein ACTFIU_007749 [Dictyostelium citrinum]